MSVATLNRPVAVSTEVEVAQKKDRSVWYLSAFACLISIASFVYFNHLGVILAYKDAISHMEIARRIIDSPTAGFGQLGGVWLPLPHLLMLPFVGINALYYDGLAGSLSSMVSYVVASVFIYKIVRDLTGKQLPALIGTLLFMSNPNILYMQSTPMTELLLFACMLGMVYYVQRWIATDDPHYLVGAGIASFLGTLSRYEAWVLLAALTVVVMIVVWRKGHSRNSAEGHVVMFLLFAGLGIVLWLGWNQLIFGNALNFQDGPYAKPSLWVGSGEKAVGHWLISLKTYWFAMVDNLWLLVVVLMICGLIVMVVKERFRLRILPALSLLVLFPFYVVALEQGQRPLHVTQVTGDLYNVRFGLLMVLPAAIFIGYLSTLLSWHRLGRYLAVGGVLVAIGFGVDTLSKPNQILTLRDPSVSLRDSYSVASNQTSRYLRTHYDGGKVLMESFGNELVLFYARVPLGENVYEGSYHLWYPALADPAAHHIKWIVMRHVDRSDVVYTHLYGKVALQAYKLVYQNDQYYVYERK